MSARGGWHSLTRTRLFVIVTATCCSALAAILIVTGTHSGVPAAARPQAARQFTLPALGQPGQKVALRQYTGRPLLVNFFSSTCAPCHKEAPLLAGFYRAHHGQIAIVGIYVADIRSSALNFARQEGISYPIGSDPNSAVAGFYDVSAIPQTFFLDARHQIIKRVFGPLTTADLNTGLAQMRSNRPARS
jgi:cytochrome c biogenesis protein CcmG/thiol:disulfide interchange protein DsbE